MGSNSMNKISMSSFSERAIELHKAKLASFEKKAIGARLRLPKTIAQAMPWISKKLPTMIPESAAWMEREAPLLFGGTNESVWRALNPIKGLQRSWAGMSPRGELAVGGAKKLKEVAKNIKSPTKWYNPGSWFKPGEHITQFTKTKIPLSGIARGEFSGPAAKQMSKQLKEKGRGRLMAEELSRRGWTGGGKITKYLPMGQKSLIAGLSAQAIPEIVNAPPATRTGEGGRLEAGLGGLGSAAGMVSGMGLGLVPGTALWYAMNKASANLFPSS